MLKDLLNPGVRILGLNTLLGKPSVHQATYRQVKGAAGLVLDFAECNKPTAADAASLVYVPAIRHRRDRRNTVRGQ
jgi:hypothetical protein